MLAVDVGLDIVGGDDFKDDEDAEDFSGVAPSVKDGDGEQGGRERGDGRSDIGDKAAESGEGSKEEPGGEGR